MSLSQDDKEETTNTAVRPLFMIIWKGCNLRSFVSSIAVTSSLLSKFEIGAEIIKCQEEANSVIRSSDFLNLILGSCVYFYHRYSHATSTLQEKRGEKSLLGNRDAHASSCFVDLEQMSYIWETPVNTAGTANVENIRKMLRAFLSMRPIHFSEFNSFCCSFTMLFMFAESEPVYNATE